MLKQISRATAVLALMAMPLFAQEETRPTVAVLPFVNSAIGDANAELAPLSKGIADLLLFELSQNTGIRIVERENLQNVFLLVDSRLEPQKNDLDMIQWLGETEIPFVIVFTKSDKLNQPKVQANVAQFKRKLKESWEELPTMFITSAETSKGRDELLGFIETVNATWGGSWTVTSHYPDTEH